MTELEPSRSAERRMLGSLLLSINGTLTMGLPSCPSCSCKALLRLCRKLVISPNFACTSPSASQVDHTSSTCKNSLLQSSSHTPAHTAVQQTRHEAGHFPAPWRPALPASAPTHGPHLQHLLAVLASSVLSMHRCLGSKMSILLVDRNTCTASACSGTTITVRPRHMKVAGRSREAAHNCSNCCVKFELQVQCSMPTC